MKWKHPISASFGTLKKTLHVKTKRLEIRFIEPADYARFTEAWVNRLPKQNEFDDESPSKRRFGKSEFSKLLRRHRYGALKDRHYAFEVFDRRSGAHLGGVDFYVFVRGAFSWANVGYSIHNHHWRKGYASEALRGALSIAFGKLGLYRVEAATELRNIASRKVALAAGMKKEVVRKKFMKTPSGAFEDMIVFSVHVSDFRSRKV